MPYVHKKDHKRIISDAQYMKLSFREKLDYRYINSGAPSLGNSTSEPSPHIPFIPDPSSFIDSSPPDTNLPDIGDFGGFGGGDGGGGGAGGDW